MSTTGNGTTKKNTATTTAAAMVTTSALTSALKTAGRMRVTVPPEFKGAESAVRWFARFEICSRSNGWDKANMFTGVALDGRGRSGPPARQGGGECGKL